MKDGVYVVEDVFRAKYSFEITLVFTEVANHSEALGELIKKLEFKVRTPLASRIRWLIGLKQGLPFVVGIKIQRKEIGTVFHFNINSWSRCIGDHGVLPRLHLSLT